MSERHKDWQGEAEERLRVIVRQQAARILDLEQRLREYELRDWSVKNRPAVAAVPFKQGRG